ncbi:hypothetical protein ACFYWP_41005 [Actinacidiphila glaucinigra]|uniref:hypothetical protein n=1 Tax=Actinacidiphila glaucinigra TaxID=235986 RepID=UPI003692BEFF
MTTAAVAATTEPAWTSRCPWSPTRRHRESAHGGDDAELDGEPDVEDLHPAQDEETDGQGGPSGRVAHGSSPRPGRVRARA